MIRVCSVSKKVEFSILRYVIQKSSFRSPEIKRYAVQVVRADPWVRGARNLTRNFFYITNRNLHYTSMRLVQKDEIILRLPTNLVTE